VELAAACFVVLLGMRHGDQLQHDGRITRIQNAVWSGVKVTYTPATTTEQDIPGSVTAAGRGPNAIIFVNLQWARRPT